MRDDLGADLVVDALGLAATSRRLRPGLIHDSDLGEQYRSQAFGPTLRDSGILGSMGSRGDVFDNADAESFMATITTGLIRRQRFKTKDESRLAVFSYIDAVCDRRRRRSALGYRSPIDCEETLREHSLDTVAVSRKTVGENGATPVLQRRRHPRTGQEERNHQT